MSRAIYFVFLFSIAGLTRGFAQSPVDWPQLKFTAVNTNASLTVQITHAGDGSGRIFLVQQSGAIRILSHGTVLPTPFLNIASRVNYSGERGLLGLAFPANFQGKKYFYVYYTRQPDGAITLSRFFLLPGNPNTADPASEQVVLTIPHPVSNHNGGQIAFGPDGFLYMGTGDGGGGGDPDNNAQNPAVLLGKMLRIDTESSTNSYQIPGRNPYLTNPAFRPEIWAFGLRNPWRFSFDRATGDLFIGDVGQNLWEEIDYQPSGSFGGQNYGWRVLEGTHDFNVPLGFDRGAVTLPVAEYSHSVGSSITGGFVFRGPGPKRMKGVYFYGDYVTGRIWGLKRVGGTWTNQELADTPFGISCFGEDEAGYLYLSDYFGGTIYRVEDVRPVPYGDFNGDGLSDGLWQNTLTGSRVITFTGGSAVEVTNWPTAWQLAGSGQFGNDGKTDILLQNSMTGQRMVWMMDGGVIRSNIVFTTRPVEWQMAATGDFNRDTRSDILWQNTVTGACELWLMNGLVQTSNVVLGAVSLGWRMVGTGDFSGDGKPDILWQHTGTGDTAVLFMDDTTPGTSAYLITAPLEWRVGGTGDFDSDGNSDILWQNITTGEWGGWLMNRTTVLQGASAGFVPLEWNLRN